jgi:hypothetical protein
MSIFILTRAIGLGITGSIMMDILTDLSTGAINGIIAGVVVGAVVIPLIQVPDALGRALLIGVLFGVGMAGYQLLQVLQVTGGTLGSILNSLDGSSGTVVGQVILNGIIYVLYAVLAGALIGVFITVPGIALKGGLIGIFLGAAVGAAFSWLLGELGVHLNPTFSRLLTGLLVFGILTAITGRN